MQFVQIVLIFGLLFPIIASAEDPTISVGNILDELAEIVKKLKLSVKIHIDIGYDEIFVKPVEKVNEKCQEIEHKRHKNPECVANEDERINKVLYKLNHQLNQCGSEYNKSLIEVLIKIDVVYKEICEDQKKIEEGMKKCLKLPLPEKVFCLKKQAIETKIIVAKTTLLVKKLVIEVNLEVSIIIEKGNKCSKAAINTALYELDKIIHDIDKCIESGGCGGHGCKRRNRSALIN